MKESNNTKGIEVLHFEDAEIEKIRSNSTSFAASGPLSVLYFKDYDRFVLQINDWKYPLLRRVRIITNSNPDNMISRSYFMPALKGFTYHLKINNIPNLPSILNFETIVNENSDFSIQGIENPMRRVETSPDDKLERKTHKDTGIKEIITEKVKSLVHTVNVKFASMKDGTKNLTSTKKRINIANLKNKNFRKNAKTSFKTDFFLNGEKRTAEFLNKRRDNINNREVKDIVTLVNTSDFSAPALYYIKDDIEESILNNKDIAINGNYNIIMGRIYEEKKSLVESLRYDLDHIKENFNTRKEELKERIRANDVKIQEKMKVFESQHQHYEA